MLAVMGTSTCHVMNGTDLAPVPGICGVVDGGILEGLYGYEAGQSGVGDIFGWFVAQYGLDPGQNLHELFSAQAAEQPTGGHGLIALDWHSGNRSILVDHHLSGVVVGLTLATRPFEIYKALIEATAFGTRKIIEAFAGAGVPVTEFVAAGGLKRNKLVMQIYADVLRRPISVATSDQAPALGSAIHAAVAAGAYPDVATAAETMGRVEKDVHLPEAASADVYDAMYAEYSLLHDYFGRETSVLHRLRAIRNEAL